MTAVHQRIDLVADKLLDEIVEEVQEFTDGGFENDVSLVGVEVACIERQTAIYIMRRIGTEFLTEFQTKVTKANR